MHLKYYNSYYQQNNQQTITTKTSACMQRRPHNITVNKNAAITKTVPPNLKNMTWPWRLCSKLKPATLDSSEEGLSPLLVQLFNL